MSSEPMAYKFGTTGHKGTSPNRVYTQEENNTLDPIIEAYKHWERLYIARDEYERAMKFTRGMTPSSDTINHFIAMMDSQANLNICGIFYSVLINRCPSQFVGINVPTENTSELGYLLAKNKILAVYANSGPYLGVGTEGIVLNYAKTSYGASTNSGGVYVNFGSEITDEDGVYQTRRPSVGIIVNAGIVGPNFCDETQALALATKPTHFGKLVYSRKGLHIPYAMIDYQPFVDYIEELRTLFAPGRDDYETTAQSLGKHPVKEVTRRIHQCIDWYTDEYFDQGLGKWMDGKVDPHHEERMRQWRDQYGPK